LYGEKLYGASEVLQMPLSDTRIRKLETREKPYMLRDDRGLYLEILPNGAKYWRIRVWLNGKEVKRSLGVYPRVTLAQARTKRDEIHAKISAGENPFKEAPAGCTFDDVAREWITKKVLPIRDPDHAEAIKSRLRRLVSPYIGDRPIEAIQPMELLDVIRKIEGQGKHEMAHRILQHCSQVFRYGIATGRCPRDTAADLRGALVPVRRKHMATFTEPEKIGALMRAIQGYDGSIIIKCAMHLGILTFVRPGELRQAEWSEFDLEKAEWKIPAAKMKMDRPHVVPLSEQALEVLAQIRSITGSGRYLFPSVRTFARPISDATVNAALRRMGYEKEELTGHGFRSMASTILNEQGWPADAIERQLAHVERNSVRAAYNFAEHLETRRQMMQAWADWLDKIKGGLN
jgi:integrase